MRTLSFALLAVAASALGGCAPTRGAQPADAHVGSARHLPHVEGIVLQIAGDVATIHHSAFGDMPSMSMPFRLVGGAHLAPGTRIEGEVDTSSDPWTLDNVRELAPPATLPKVRRAARAFVKVGDRAPDLAFIDQRGVPFSLASLRGHPYLLTFAYTRCVDARMCPLVSAKLARLQHTLAASGNGTQLVEVTLDPAFDRPTVLARYGAGFGADPTRWHLLTGEPVAVAGFAFAYGIDAERIGAQIVHSERLAIVDANGRIARLIDDATWQPHSIASVVAGLDRRS